MKAWRLLCFLALLAAGCAPSRPLTVSAAASLQTAFREIAAHEKQQVSFNFGGSGALQKQIEEGAPVDVYASASPAQMQALERGQLLDGPPRYFAGNRLVLIAPLQSPLRSFAELKGVGRVAVGNPKTVPAGHYARQSLQSQGLWNDLQARLVPAEDVRQVVDYVARGEVDAGLVYASDLGPARVRRVADAPPPSYEAIRYPIAVLRASSHKAEARRFVEAVCGPQGQAILRRHGFQSAP